MAQFVTRVDEELAQQVDALVAAGTVGSRSEAVRLGLVTLVEEHRRRLVGEQIAFGYTSKPQTEEELAGLDDATRALIAEEPW
jgi:Arc/MetJ-type ribon-helix-helix transcriptional regulator